MHILILVYEFLLPQAPYVAYPCLTGSIFAALAFHNEQLQASAFREEYDPANFEDLTLPPVDKMHKVCDLIVLSAVVT